MGGKVRGNEKGVPAFTGTPCFFWWATKDLNLEPTD